MRAFSLIELIFVVVIIAIILAVGVNYLPKTRAISDAESIKFKLLATRTNALGYKTAEENDYTCITLSKDVLNKNEKNSNENVKFLIKSDIRIEGLKNGNTICFDNLGRAYDGRAKIENLLHNKIFISVISEREINLTLYPISGFIR